MDLLSETELRICTSFPYSNTTKMSEGEKHLQPQQQLEMVLEIDDPITKIESNPKCTIHILYSSSCILSKIHAGYFRIALALTSQALLWKILIEPIQDAHALRRLFTIIPSTALILIWSVALATLVTLSFLYILRCFFHFDRVKNEFMNPVGVNYMFVPWISGLFLLQSSPHIPPTTVHYQVLWLLLVAPVVVLDVKIYGQWFTKGKRLLAIVANPASQLSVIGNLVGAQAAARMGWRESGLCIFSLGMAHYLVLFVTLYQRLAGDNSVSVMMRPVFFLFFAAPSVASLSWHSISGKVDDFSKLLFFLSLFLFTSLVARPMLFRRAMKKYSVAWWAYSFPLTALALASAEYAHEVKGVTAHVLMLVLSAFSVLVSLFLMLVTLLYSHRPPKSHSSPTKPSSDSTPNDCTAATSSSIDFN